ncbi:MAG: hypothetical protein R2795_18040 [Saprospiraceae bacterium]
MAAGAFAQIALTLSHIPDALLIPTDAVIPKLNQQVVYQIKGGTVKETAIQSGVRLTKSLQVINGLSVGDTVMVSGLLQAKPGMPVLSQEMNVDITAE